MRVPLTPRQQLTARTVLVACFATLAACPSAVLAQKIGDRVRVRAGTALRAVSGGDVLGVLSREFEGKIESVQGTGVRLRLTGYVAFDELRLEGGQGRALAGGSTGAIVRAGASVTDAQLAEIKRGSTIFTGARSGNFIEVNRPVWVDKIRLTKAGAPTVAAAPPAGGGNAAPPAAPKPAPLPKSVPYAADAPPLETSGAATLKNAPDGEVLATIPGGVIVTPIAKEAGWVRVRMEGWLPDNEVNAAGARAAGAVTAADLKADPETNKGRIVRWTVEAISYQTADQVRREMTVGESYLLARGPGNERSILYLTVPDSLITAARALAPMAPITITARVRSGRSQPAGIPILDLLSLSRK